MINTIKDKIIESLKSLNSIAEVNSYDKVGFESNPAVNVTMAENTNEFWSVSSNMRGYNFTIRVIIPLKGNPNDSQYDNSKEQTEKTMGDVIDDIIKVFDEDITLGNIVEFLRAAPSKWGYVETESGWVRIGEINLQCIKITNVR